jgi:hypothetical protein
MLGFMDILEKKLKDPNVKEKDRKVIRSFARKVFLKANQINKNMKRNYRVPVSDVVNDRGSGGFLP